MADSDRLTKDFALRHPDAFARVLARAAPAEAEELLEQLPIASRVAIISRLPARRINALLDSQKHQPVDWLEEASLDDAVQLLSRLPRERRLALVNQLPRSNRKRQLLRLQQYPAHSIGSLMGDIPLYVSMETAATEVLAQLRELDDDVQVLVVVVDAQGGYIGAVDLWRLLLRNPSAGTVKDFLATVKAVQPETPIAIVAMNEEWQRRNILPVIDHKGRILGSITRQKVIRAAEGQSGRNAQGRDVMLNLLTDLMQLGENVLSSTFTGKRAK